MTFILLLTVFDFLSAIGTEVTEITYDTTQSFGVTVDGTSANVYNVKITGEFSNSDLYHMPETLVTADLRGLNTSGVTDFSNMFVSCSSLTSLNISSFDTSNATVFFEMFEGCSALTSLDVSSFDTSKATDFSYMFRNCSGLTSLDVSNFDTSKAAYFSYMFYGCSGLTSLDVSNFNTSSGTSFNNMFASCSALTSIALPDLSSATSLNAIFSGCTALAQIDVSGMTSATDISSMFYNCTALAQIDVSAFTAVTAADYAFYGCSNLSKITGWNLDADKVESCADIFTGCPDSLEVLIPYTLSTDDKFHLVRIRTGTDGSATVRNQAVGDAEAADISVSASAGETLTLSGQLDEIAVADEITDDQFDLMFSYRYGWNTGDCLEPDKENFVIWAKNETTVRSNIANATLSLSNSDFDEIFS